MIEPLRTLPAFPSLRFCVVEPDDIRLLDDESHSAFPGEVVFDDGVVYISRTLFATLEAETGGARTLQ